MDFDLWPLVIIADIVGFIFRIQKLKYKTDYRFNLVPVYLLALPIVAILTNKLAVNKAAVYTRENVIQKTESLIAGIEKNKAQKGTYPDQLDDLKEKYVSKIPSLNLMGVRAYDYKKKQRALSAFF